MKLLNMYRKELVRPILYRSVSRGLIALAAVLCWNRFINVNHFLSVRRDAFCAAGILFWVFGWFVYLRIDGIRLPGLYRRQEKKKPKWHTYGDIMDFTDEHIVAFDELSEKEQDLCRLAVYVILGSLFFFLSFFRL